MDLGHHQAEMTMARPLFRPVRDDGHLLPQGRPLGGPTENGDLAKAIIENAIVANGGVRPDYIHADNGTSMTSKPSPAALRPEYHP